MLCWYRVWRPGWGGHSEGAHFLMVAGRELLWRVVLPGMLGTPPEKTCLESVSPVPDDSVHILCPQVYHFLLKLAREQCCLQLRALTQRGGQVDTLDACRWKWRK